MKNEKPSHLRDILVNILFGHFYIVKNYFGFPFSFSNCFKKSHLSRITSKSNYFREFPGSLVVRIQHFAVARVQSLVREPNFYKPYGTAKKKKKK